MRKLIALTLLSALSASVQATPPDAPNRLFQGRDLFALQLTTDPQIGPTAARSRMCACRSTS